MHRLFDAPARSAGHAPTDAAKGARAFVRHHPLRLSWHNYYDDVHIAIEEVRVCRIGGPDGNGDGLRNWVDAKLGRACSVDSPRESYVSPACIEGTADYVSMMQITRLPGSGGGVGQAIPVRRGIDNRWYANVPLSATEITHAQVSFHNGAKTKEHLLASGLLTRDRSRQRYGLP